MKKADLNAVILILSLVVLAVGSLFLVSDSFAEPALDEKTADLIHVNTKAPAAATICQRLWNEDGFIIEDPENFPLGHRPQVYREMARKWASHGVQVTPVEAQKTHFICNLLVVTARANQEVWIERQRVLSLLSDLKAGRTWNDLDHAFLIDLRERLRLDESAGFDEILRRLDVVPFGLILSQAASESFWGTSRLAVKVKNLFGRTAIKGVERCEPAKDNKNICYRIYSTVEEAVRDQIRYWNTSIAGEYHDRFRRARAAMRAKKQSLDSMKLIESVVGYAETGKQYTSELRGLLVGQFKLGAYRFNEKPYDHYEGTIAAAKSGALPEASKMAEPTKVAEVKSDQNDFLEVEILKVEQNQLTSESERSSTNQAIGDPRLRVHMPWGKVFHGDWFTQIEQDIMNMENLTLCQMGLGVTGTCPIQ